MSKKIMIVLEKWFDEFPASSCYVNIDRNICFEAILLRKKSLEPFQQIHYFIIHSEKHSSFCFETKLKRRYWNTGTNFNCSSQPSSVHWLSTSIFPCSFDVCLSRHYDVSSFFSLFGRPNQPRHHTWYLSRTPRVYSCKFFLAGVNF